jgi:hypothetical protein
MKHMDTPTSSSLNEIKANTQVLAFDIFGTVVDWHGSIVREMQALYPAVDANAFALAWRADYQPAMARVRSGALGWTRIDELHRLPHVTEQGFELCKSTTVCWMALVYVWSWTCRVLHTLLGNFVSL